jgi:hypothetical protein
LSEDSLPAPAQSSTRKEFLAGQVEAELDRLRAARPALADRIDRAAGILLLQLSSPPRMRPIRCRVGAMGPKFLVSSGRERGATYVLRPHTWACSCPDQHRTGLRACKHSISCWILWKIGCEPRPCACCIDGWVYVGHTELVNADTGEVVETVDRIPCRRCGGPA